MGGSGGTSSSTHSGSGSTSSSTTGSGGCSHDLCSTDGDCCPGTGWCFEGHCCAEGIGATGCLCGDAGVPSTGLLPPLPACDTEGQACNPDGGAVEDGGGGCQCVYYTYQTPCP